MDASHTAKIRLRAGDRSYFSSSARSIPLAADYAGQSNGINGIRLRSGNAWAPAGIGSWTHSGVSPQSGALSPSGVRVTGVSRLPSTPIVYTSAASSVPCMPNVIDLPSGE